MLDLMVNEVDQVDGVDVEEVRRVPGPVGDPPSMPWKRRHSWSPSET